MEDPSKALLTIKKAVEKAKKTDWGEANIITRRSVRVVKMG